MAHISTWTPEDERHWQAWLAALSPVMQSLGQQFRPNRLYRLKTTGERVVPVRFAEDGTLTVIVSARYNFVVSSQYNLDVFDRRIDGIAPDALEECALPGPEDETGILLVED